MDYGPPGSSIRGLLHPLLGDLPNLGIEPASLTSPELAARFFTTWKVVKCLLESMYIYIHQV